MGWGGVEMAKPCSWSNPLEKQELTWRRCNVTSKMRCRCGFATNPLRNRTFFEVPNLQIMQKNAGEIENHNGIGPENWHESSKKLVKRMIAKIPIIKKTLFYTDEKPGGSYIHLYRWFCHQKAWYFIAIVFSKWHTLGCLQLRLMVPACTTCPLEPNDGLP